MTGRVCPVHGEWSADGVCRWCEHEPAPDPVELPWMAGQWRKPDRVEWKGGVPSYFWDLGMFEIPKPTYVEIRCVAVVPRYDRTEAYIDADTHAAEESRLLAQHAALRWERVARRWNYKHRGGGGTEEGRAYVWRWWLEQMDRQSAGLPLAGPFPLGFYAW